MKTALILLLATIGLTARAEILAGPIVQSSP